VEIPFAVNIYPTETLSNKIKCKKCNEEFVVKNNEFKSNESLSKLIDGKSYLSVDEIKLKHELEVSIKRFFEFYDAFSQNFSQNKN
jgi:hypothetical protein